MTEDQKAALCKTFAFLPFICNINKLNDLIFAGSTSFKNLDPKNNQNRDVYHRFFFLYRDASIFQLSSLTDLKMPLSYCYQPSLNSPNLINTIYEQELNDDDQKSNLLSDDFHQYSWILRLSIYHPNCDNEFQTITFWKSENPDSACQEKRINKMSQKEFFFLTSNCWLYGEYVLRRLLSM